MRLCIKCGSSNVVKNGFVRGLQRRKCKACGYTFTKGRGYDMRTRMQALMLYRENVSIAFVFFRKLILFRLFNRNFKIRFKIT